jgi:hypothetical protein
MFFTQKTTTLFKISSKRIFLTFSHFFLVSDHFHLRIPPPYDVKIFTTSLIPVVNFQIFIYL